MKKLYETLRYRNMIGVITSRSVFGVEDPHLTGLLKDLCFNYSMNYVGELGDRTIFDFKKKVLSSNATLSYRFLHAPISFFYS